MILKTVKLTGVFIGGQVLQCDNICHAALLPTSKLYANPVAVCNTHILKSLAFVALWNDRPNSK